jgi:hypothetical protein
VSCSGDVLSDEIVRIKASARDHVKLVFLKSQKQCSMIENGLLRHNDLPRSCPKRHFLNSGFIAGYWLGDNIEVYFVTSLGFTRLPRM